MFTNKHVVIALIVAPILSILAYYGVDQIVAEPPQKAMAGESYPLVPKSNCRYTSGICTMENGDFELQITVKDNSLHVTSPYALSTVQTFLLINDNTESADKQIFQKLDESGQNWSLALNEKPNESSQLRLVAIADNSIYYGETDMAFIDYETIFHKDFIRK